jgi:hypothetical protein
MGQEQTAGAGNLGSLLLPRPPAPATCHLLLLSAACNRFPSSGVLLDRSGSLQKREMPD